jgi:hypothetical protein
MQALQDGRGAAVSANSARAILSFLRRDRCQFHGSTLMLDDRTDRYDSIRARLYGNAFLATRSEKALPKTFPALSHPADGSQSYVRAVMDRVTGEAGFSDNTHKRNVLHSLVDDGKADSSVRCDEVSQLHVLSLASTPA